MPIERHRSGGRWHIIWVEGVLSFTSGATHIEVEWFAAQSGHVKRGGDSQKRTRCSAPARRRRPDFRRWISFGRTHHRGFRLSRRLRLLPRSHGRSAGRLRTNAAELLPLGGHRAGRCGLAGEATRCGREPSRHRGHLAGCSSRLRDGRGRWAREGHRRLLRALPKQLAAHRPRLPPRLILHGVMDPIVPVSRAYAIERLLKEQGTSYETKVNPGQGRGLTVRPRLMWPLGWRASWTGDFARTELPCSFAVA